MHAMAAEREVDLLVAGAGPAGMTAALVASLETLLNLEAVEWSRQWVSDVGGESLKR